MLRFFIKRTVRLGMLLAITACAGVYGGPASESVKPSSFLDMRESGEFNLRMMSWNVWKFSIFPPNGIRRESFERIVGAVRPDVICLQEVTGPMVATELPGLMNRLLPLEDNLKWQIHCAPNSDNAVISRYPLLHRSHEYVIPLPQIAPKFHLGYVGCVIDLPNSANIPDVYVIAAHFLSAGNKGIQARQRHSDSIIRHLRQLRQADKQEILPVATPIVILGDLNVYAATPKDAAHHLTTLLTGNIVNEAEFGPDIDLDWDGSFMMEVKPRHNGRVKEWYTWRSDEGPYPSGALDRIIYTDSVMEVHHSFVLNTTTMTEEELARSGLLATDVLRRSKPGDFDHLPLVVDFTFHSDEITKLKSAQQIE